MVVNGLKAHTGLRAMAGIDQRSSGKSIDLLAQGTHQRFAIAKGQVGTAHGTEEKQVARDEDTKIFKIRAKATRRMARSVNNIAVGDEVAVLMTAVSAEPLTGIVATVAPTVGQTGTYAVTVELDNAEGIIKAGMMAEVSFTAEKAEDTIVLPRNAVIEKDDQTYVYIVKDGTAKKVIVETGIDTGESIEIRKGLKDGDAVVTKGQTYISDGEAVNVTNAEVSAEASTEEKGE